MTDLVSLLTAGGNLGVLVFLVMRFLAFMEQVAGAHQRQAAQHADALLAVVRENTTATERGVAATNAQTHAVRNLRAAVYMLLSEEQQEKLEAVEDEERRAP